MADLIPSPPPKPQVTSQTPITSAMERSLADTLSKIPSTGRGYAQIDVTMTGARLEVAQRLRSGWTAGGWAGLAYGQRLEAGVRLRRTW